MIWSLVDEIPVLVHGDRAPSNDEWQAWLSEYQKDTRGPSVSTERHLSSALRRLL
jgi:hypothetical protein